jgi:hypothetical protein
LVVYQSFAASREAYLDVASTVALESLRAAQNQFMRTPLGRCIHKFHSRLEQALGDGLGVLATLDIAELVGLPVLCKLRALSFSTYCGVHARNRSMQISCAPPCTCIEVWQQTMPIALVRSPVEGRNAGSNICFNIFLMRSPFIYTNTTLHSVTDSQTTRHMYRNSDYFTSVRRDDSEIHVSRVSSQVSGAMGSRRPSISFSRCS